MQKAWLLPLFLSSMLVVTGYALASPEDEVADSLEVLERLADSTADPLPEKVAQPDTATEDLGEIDLQSEKTENKHLLAEQDEREKNEQLEEGISPLNFLFLNSELPLPETDNHSGDLSSHTHGIPEPMVFDLVRPLGAKKGELEINTLFLGRWRRDRFSTNWAPEVEYAFRDGMAVEFELPMSNLQTNALKLAFQSILPSRSERFAHGIQLFGEYELHHRHVGLAAVHIGGVRLTEKLSLMSINGAQNANLMKRPRLAGLVNNTLFYRKSDKVTLGVETNLYLKRRENTFLLMPQLHLELSAHYSIQVGAGFRKESRLALAPMVGMRLIRTF